MTGGILELIARNDKDLILIGKPEITPFKKLYRKLSLFAIMQHTVILPELILGKSYTNKLSYSRDLISKLYLEIDIPEFLLEKRIIEDENILSYTDRSYLVKKEILLRLTRIEEKLDYVLNDNTIRRFSPDSLGRFLEILDIKLINPEVKEYYIDYDDNYKIISYLLKSNLIEESMILGLYLLDYLSNFNEIVLDTGNNILVRKYNNLLDEYIKKYFLEIPFLNKKNYQIVDIENNEDIFNQTILYYLDNPITSDLKYIRDNVQTDQELISLLKNVVDFDFNYLVRILFQLFPEDNFYSGFEYEKYVYPFYILLSYDSKNNNQFNNIIDRRFTLETFWVNNFINLGKGSGFVSPITQITETQLTSFRGSIQTEFQAFNYQNLLGSNPKELWAIIASIQELWKWQIYNYNNSDTNFVPSYEITGLPSSIVSFQFSLLRSIPQTRQIYENLKIDFSLRNPSPSTPPLNIKQVLNIDDAIEVLFDGQENIIKFNDAFSHLNRAGFDLNLLYVYIFNLFCENLKQSKMFKSNSSLSWIDWMFQVVAIKMFSRWVSQFTVRNSTDYLRVESVISIEGETTVNIEERTPFTTISDTEYILDSDILKRLVRNQITKYNYITSLEEDNINVNSIGILETTKIYKRIELVKRENIVLKYPGRDFYHHPNNKYYLSKDSKLIFLDLIDIKDTEILFKGEIEEDMKGDLICIIRTSIPIIEYDFDSNIDDIDNYDISENEIDRYQVNMIVKSGDKIIDILRIPSKWIKKESPLTESSILLPEEIEEKYIDYNLEYYIVDNIDLPNLETIISKTNSDELRISDKIGIYDFTGLIDTSNNNFEDELRLTSYYHQIPFCVKKNNKLIFYHMPYKLNSQILNGVEIEYKSILNRTNLITEFRLNNFMNYYSIDDNKVRVYSEGLDFYDVNLDFNFFDNLSNIEEEHMEIIYNVLLGLLNERISVYGDLIRLLDTIQNTNINTFINELIELRKIGFTYNKILDIFENKNQNNISINQLKYWKGESFENYYYWKSNVKFSSGGAFVNRTYFDDLPVFNITEPLHSLVNVYKPNKIYSEKSIEYLNNIGGQLKNQLNKLTNNRDMLLKYPKITDEKTFNSTSLETEYLVEQVLTDNVKNEYILETFEDFSENDIIRIDNKSVRILDKLEENKYNIESVEYLDVSIPEEAVSIENKNSSFIKGGFYGYGVLRDNLISLLPDLSKKYILCDSSFNELGIVYNEINDSLIKIDDLSDNIMDIVLKDDEGNFYPYGHIIFSFNEENIYYRKRSFDNKGTIFLLRGYILEGVNIIDNIIISNINFGSENNYMPIIQLRVEDFIYETYNVNMDITEVNNKYSIEIDKSLKLRALDYVYIEDKWYQIESVNNPDNNIYELYESNLVLTEGSININLRVFRYLNQCIPSVNYFKSVDINGDIDYDYQNLEWNKHIFLYQELIPLNIISQNGAIVKLEQELEVGDILFSENDYYQITNKLNNEYKFNPIKLLREVSLVKNAFNIDNYLTNNAYLNGIEIGKNQVFYLPNRHIPTNNYFINLFDKEEWLYREIKVGDLYFDKNELKLNLSLTTGNYWILQPRYNFISFKYISDDWFELDVIDNFEINIGSIILDITPIPLINTFDLSGSYQGKPIGIIDGKLGNLVHMKSIDGYDITMINGERLIQQYPWRFKSPYNKNPLPKNKECQCIFVWDNTTIDLFDGDLEEAHVIYLDLPVNISTTKGEYLSGDIEGDLSGNLPNQIIGNRLTITSQFNENMIIPRQEILVDNVRAIVFKIDNNELGLSRVISNFEKSINNISILKQAEKELFINNLEYNPFYDLFNLSSNTNNISISCIELDEDRDNIINHYIENVRILELTNFGMRVLITNNFIEFINNSENDLMMNINNLYLDTDYLIDEVEMTLSLSFFKKRRYLNYNKILLFEEITKENQKLIHYCKLGFNEKEEVGIAFLNNQKPFDKNSLFYLDRKINSILHSDVFKIRRDGNNYFLQENIEIDNTNFFITLRDNEVFNGNGYEIRVEESNGLFRCIGSNLSSSPIIRDLKVVSRVLEGGGGIVRSNSRYFRIENCIHIGDIGLEGGGICGSNTGNNGDFEIKKCYSNGECLGGGILGSNSCNNGIGIIEECGFVGEIIGGGGIIGNNSCNNGELRIRNSYTTGDIENGGGIIGNGSIKNEGFIFVDNSYSLGGVNNGGGIVGNNIGSLDCELYIFNCYCKENTDIFGSIDIDNSNSSIEVNIGSTIENVGSDFSSNIQYELSPGYGIHNILGFIITSGQVSETRSKTRTYTSTTWSSSVWFQEAGKYARLSNFRQDPYIQGSYLLNISIPEFDISSSLNLRYYYLEMKNINFNNIIKYDDESNIKLDIFKKVEIDILDTLKKNDLFYLESEIKSDYLSMVSNNMKFFIDPRINDDSVIYKSDGLYSELPISLSKTEYYIKLSSKIRRLYPRFKRINNQLVNITEDINNILITQNDTFIRKLDEDYLIIPYKYDVKNITDNFKGVILTKDESIGILNDEYEISINDPALIISNIKNTNEGILIENTEFTDLLKKEIVIQNIDLIYKIIRDDNYYNVINNIHQNLIIRKYTFNDFMNRTYLLNLSLLNIDWDMFYKINQSYLNNETFDDSIVDLSGVMYFEERFININDYLKIIEYDLSDIDTSENERHDYINLIINQIYQRLPNWVLLEEFRESPDMYLNNWLNEHYNLSYDGEFKENNISYLKVKIPTYYEIVNNEIRLKITGNNSIDEIDNLFSILDDIRNGFKTNSISFMESLEISKMVDFYSLWDKINNFRIDLSSYLENNKNIFGLVGNRTVLSEEELNLNIVYQIINDNSPFNLIDRNLLIEQKYNYLVNVERSPKLYNDLVSFNKIDFLRDHQIFYDPVVDNIDYSGKTAEFIIPKFLENQEGIINGKLLYEVIEQKKLGIKTLIETVNSIELDLSDSNSRYKYKLFQGDSNLNYNIIDGNNFEIIDNNVDSNISIGFELNVPISLKNGRFYLPNDINIFIQNETTYLRRNNSLELLDISNNEILNYDIDNYSTRATLVRFSLITTSSVSNIIEYNLLLNRELDLEPYIGYETSRKDFILIDIENNIIENYEIELKKSENVLIRLEDEIDIKFIQQRFKIDNSPRYTIENYDISGNDIYIEIERVDTSGYNNIYFQYTDKNNNEVGNYLIRFEGIDLSDSFIDKEVYLLDGKYVGRIVEISSSTVGWISLLKFINIDSYDVVIPELLSSFNMILTNDYIETYFRVESDGILKNNNLEVEFDLPSVLPKINDNSSILLGRIVLTVNDNIIKNILLERWRDKLENLQENYFRKESKMRIEKEKPIFQEDLGFNIIEKINISLENKVIEEFDKDSLNLDRFYFGSESKERGMDMILNGNKLIIPIPFWFSKGYYNSLPIFLSNGSTFNLSLTLSKLGELVYNEGIFVNNLKLLGRYRYEAIYLSEDEKKMISTRSQEYLINTWKYAQQENIVKSKNDIYMKFRGGVKDFFYIFKIPSNKWKETYLEKIDMERLDNFYREYLMSKGSNKYKEYEENKIEYNEITEKYDDEYEDFINYLIYNYINDKNDLEFIDGRIRLYFRRVFKGEIRKRIYPLESGELVINDRQVFTKKDEMFWTELNQMYYEKTGGMDKYGYKHCLYPLEDQPSGHLNYNLVKGFLRLSIKREFMDELRKKYGFMRLKIYYREYHLLKFIGNQVGIIF